MFRLPIYRWHNVKGYTSKSSSRIFEVKGPPYFGGSYVPFFFFEGIDYFKRPPVHPEEIYISSLDVMHKGVNCVCGRHLSVYMFNH